MLSMENLIEKKNEFKKRKQRNNLHIIFSINYLNKNMMNKKKFSKNKRILNIFFFFYMLFLIQLTVL